MKAAAPTCQRQRSYKAVAVPVLEAALHPRLAVGDTTSSIYQQLDVTKRCLIRGVKWHVSPRRSHCLNDTTRMAKRNKITSQRRGRRSKQWWRPAVEAATADDETTTPDADSWLDRIRRRGSQSGAAAQSQACSPIANEIRRKVISPVTTCLSCRRIERSPSPHGQCWRPIKANCGCPLATRHMMLRHDHHRRGTRWQLSHA